MNDGRLVSGFVVREAAAVVTLRNAAAQEFTFAHRDITKREVLENVSLMPPGLASNLGVEDFSSLLRYMEELTEKNSQKQP
jgi:hypothetical protein